MMYDVYQRGLALMIYKYFDKKSRETTTHTGTGIIHESQ